MKINGLSNYDFGNESASLKKRYYEEFEKLLLPILKTRTWFYALIFNLLFTIFTLAFLALFITSFAYTKHGHFKVFVIPTGVAFVLAFVSYFPSNYFSKKVKNKTQETINFEQVLKAFLEEKYEDVKVSSATKLSDEEAKTLLTSTTTLVKIRKNFAGPTITVQNLAINFSHIQWSPFASNSKREYINTLLVSVQHMPKRWEGFYFKFQRANKLTKTLHLNNDQNLENKEFDKIFFYESNDPIRLRILLTPSVQETLVNKYFFTKKANEQIMTWNKNSFTTSINVPFKNSFIVPGRVRYSKRKYIKTAVRDVVNRIKTIEEQIALISTFREFTKNK